MNRGFWKSLCFCVCIVAATMAMGAVTGSPESIPIKSLTIDVVGEPGSEVESTLSTLKTKEQERFSQTEFDKDLKLLAQEFDRVEPTVEVTDGEVVIRLKVWKKPVIHAVVWNGNQAVDTDKLQKELGVAAGSVYDKQGFNKAIQKLRQYYVKKGFFESEIDYKAVPTDQPNTVDINIDITEGRAGYVDEIRFKGFTSEEEDELCDRLMTKEYCWYLSWLTNQGTFYKDVFRQDEMIALTFLQDKGYLDARVTTDISPSPDKTDRIIITICVDKGEMYHVGKVSVEGNTLLPTDTVLKTLAIKTGDVYSPEAINRASTAVMSQYGSKGYVDTSVVPDPRLREGERTFDVVFHIDEGKCYRVGMIEIIGNTTTESRVILHENLLVPGAVFDTNLLAKTEERLRNIGYFKTVNVYAVKSTRVGNGEGLFRDVHIEVEEIPTTARFTAFVGWNADESFAGGVGVSETNFRATGITRLFSDGWRAMRGGGENVSVNATFGIKQVTYTLSWTKPYFLDTNWVLGVDLMKQRNSYASSDYTIHSSSALITGKYTLNPFLIFGTHYRIHDSDIDLKGIHERYRRNRELIRESKNGGVISAVGTELYYNSTNHPVLPSEGIRSTLSLEFAGVGGDHRFVNLAYNNAFFYSPTKKGVFKFRADAQAIKTLFGTHSKELPLDERLYLGGDQTMRGFRFNGVGPKFQDKSRTPRGGMTSLLFSGEYERPLYKRLNGFLFADLGNVWWKEFHVGRMQYTQGFGLRFYIADTSPLTVGVGFPVKPQSKHDVRRFFFSLGVAF